jgi:hypothetical protein
MSPRNSHGEALSPKVTTSGDSLCEEEIKVKCHDLTVLSPPCEDTARRQPCASQEESPHQKPNELVP